jgi:hypothetical protein
MKVVLVKAGFKSTIFKTETMPDIIRKLPPVCLSIAILKLLSGRLRMSREFVGRETVTEDGQVFTIFRQITNRKAAYSDRRITFIVRFKFARLSHKANKVASIIPMLLIAGFPGFVQKAYAVNKENGYWQGMYEWKSAKHLDAYKQSLVFRMMNKRALEGSVQSNTFTNGRLSDLIDTDKSEKEQLL